MVDTKDQNSEYVGKFSFDAPTIDKEVAVISKINNYFKEKKLDTHKHRVPKIVSYGSFTIN